MNRFRKQNSEWIQQNGKEEIFYFCIIPGNLNKFLVLNSYLRVLFKHGDSEEFFFG